VILLPQSPECWDYKPHAQLQEKFFKFQPGLLRRKKRRRRRSEDPVLQKLLESKAKGGG
jgi:hypothetical protein